MPFINSTFEIIVLGETICCFKRLLYLPSSHTIFLCRRKRLIALWSSLYLQVMDCGMLSQMRFAMDFLIRYHLHLLNSLLRLVSECLIFIVHNCLGPTFGVLYSCVISLVIARMCTSIGRTLTFFTYFSTGGCCND